MKPYVIYMAAAAIGPVTIDVLGYDLPVLSAIISTLGVVLASLIAPPPPLSLVKKIALICLLVILMLALVISDPTRSPLLSTAWAIGIGYTGLPIIQAISDRIFQRNGELTGLPSLDRDSPSTLDKNVEPKA